MVSQFAGESHPGQTPAAPARGLRCQRDADRLPGGLTPALASPIPLNLHHHWLIAMKRPVIAIGLDAADPELLETWMAAGKLPNLNRLVREGAYGRLRNTVEFCGKRSEVFSTEPLWVEFATGCRPTKTGYWDTIRYLPERYTIWNDKRETYDFAEFPPFYALGDRARVAVFDLPDVRLSAAVQGIQILGWGGHFPHTVSASLPEQALPDIIQAYGENPILFKDTGIWWNDRYVTWSAAAAEDSVRKRQAICLDLMRQDDWDLFLPVFPEPHTVGHDLYHLSQDDHPLHAALTRGRTGPDPLLENYRSVDRAIGTIADAAPRDAAIVCFSLHGMGPNYSDMLSSVFLPELLFRDAFPGRCAIAPGQPGTQVPPPDDAPLRHTWTGETWLHNRHPDPLRQRVRRWYPTRWLSDSLNGLDSPFSTAKRRQPFGWNPCLWYQPLWPTMPAFALPGFTKGHVRINVRGRDPSGIVAPEDYRATCDRIAEWLYRIADARSGQPLVRQVSRTRDEALDPDPKKPYFDLDVLWHEHITDTVDSPELGRIGPVTYWRAGGHRNSGFFVARGDGIAAGTTLRTGECVDLAPTLLGLMRMPIPDYFDGRSLLT